jgi:hypothetical protein
MNMYKYRMVHNQCWTDDRENLPHPKRCPFCDQEDETIHHLLTGCVFARQFWHVILQRVGLADLATQPTDTHFDNWWSRTLTLVSNTVKKGLNSLVILGVLALWKHRNNCVFNGVPPSLATVLIMTGDKSNFWCMAGLMSLAGQESGGDTGHLVIVVG